MIEVDQDKHPGLYRYAIELLEYPELTDEQYAAAIADLKKPDDAAAHIAAREKLICAHLGMILATAIHHSNDFYISAEDFVGIGNEALVTEFFKFSPNRNARFSTFMRKVVKSWVLKNIRARYKTDGGNIGRQRTRADGAQKSQPCRSCDTEPIFGHLSISAAPF